jgi:hypothetical protein
VVQKAVTHELSEEGHTFVLFLDVRVHVGGRDPIQELDIFVGVELGHFAFRCWLCTLIWVVFSVTKSWDTE